jgi:Heterokaryon incompatibility protein (HET)
VSVRGEYVTLSHCWGKAKIIRLEKENMRDFERGIPISSLPLTFQQAIDFARRLSRAIRYIWIDSLCIVQDDAEDWLSESVQMYSVYRNSYCNVSATAAVNSSEGLYFDRDPQYLWEDEINLNTEGIPRPMSESLRGRLLGLEPLVRRCKIQDGSFWDREVDDAPVNRRAWVLQERLLAPRVLHFCKDQIAWECRHVDAAECLPYGVSTMELKAGTVKERARLKALIQEDYGPPVLAPNPIEKSFAAHENWKRVVERYSTTGLTKPEDKLIALAGIAELISRGIGPKVAYVAGMWEKFLASQLLWRVNPHYEDGRMRYPQRRSPVWRAPSFSWAAVNAPQGIRCGETLREEDLEISIENIPAIAKDPNRRFGLVEPKCHVELLGALKPIKILATLTEPADDAPIQTADKGLRYVGRLLEEPEGSKRAGLHNLYLDSPHDDFRDLEDGVSPAFCIPGYKDSTGCVVCLLVEPSKDEEGVYYRRLGLAVVPAFENCQKTIWDERKKKQRIRLK